MIPLFDHFPSLKEKLPHIALGEFPTPIEHLVKLGKEIGTDRLYLKQDGISGTKYGGNKIRKLEFLLADALRKNAREVLTFGFAGSNHALATAVYAREMGLKCTSVLLAQPNANYVRQNLLFNHVCGADIYHHKNETAAYAPTLLRLFGRVFKHGKIPYLITPGGSSSLGTIGYVNAGFELREQVSTGLMPEPDYLFVPLGTMGTAVGLTIGLRAAGFKTHVICVRVVDEKYGNRKKFLRLFRKTLDLLRSLDASFPSVEINDHEVDILHDFFGTQYARFTDQGMVAIDQALKSEGIRLDGTYTGKTMAALIDRVRDQELKDKVTLFWNTYNARDFSETIKDVNYKQLPDHFHRYFEKEVQPLDKSH